jgi:hypothetical protein
MDSISISMNITVFPARRKTAVFRITITSNISGIILNPSL